MLFYWVCGLTGTSMWVPEEGGTKESKVEKNIMRIMNKDSYLFIVKHNLLPVNTTIILITIVLVLIHN